MICLKVNGTEFFNSVAKHVFQKAGMVPRVCFHCVKILYKPVRPASNIVRRPMSIIIQSLNSLCPSLYL